MVQTVFPVVSLPSSSVTLPAFQLKFSRQIRGVPAEISEEAARKGACASGNPIDTTVLAAKLGMNLLGMLMGYNCSLKEMKFVNAGLGINSPCPLMESICRTSPPFS